MQQQWLMTLQGLSASGRSWDVRVCAEQLSDEQSGKVNAIPALLGDVAWSASLIRHGDVYRLSGQWQAMLRRQCSRCNAPFDWQVSALMERNFMLGDAQLEHSGDADTGEDICERLPAPGELDLLDVLREDIWLAWKADVVCSDACKGLCLGCGCNLNTGACNCEQDEFEHPFAALRQLKLDG